jgi:hypothetical protein
MRPFSYPPDSARFATRCKSVFASKTQYLVHIDEGCPQDVGNSKTRKSGPQNGMLEHHMVRAGMRTVESLSHTAVQAIFDGRGNF